MNYSKFLVTAILFMMGTVFMACDKEDEGEKVGEKAGVHRVEIELKSEGEMDYILQIVPASAIGSCSLFYDLSSDESGVSGSYEIGTMESKMESLNGTKKFIYYTDKNCTSLNVNLLLTSGFNTVDFAYKVKFFIDGEEVKSYEDKGTIEKSYQRMFNSTAN